MNCFLALFHVCLDVYPYERGRCITNGADYKGKKLFLTKITEEQQAAMPSIQIPGLKSFNEDTRSSV